MTLSFTTPEPPPRERTQIDLDGEELWAVQPKAGQLLMLDSPGASEAEVIQGFLDLCMEPESAARLRERMSDPEDAFDLDTLTKIIQGLQAAWAARPTGRSKPSSVRRRPTGHTSTETARSTA